MNGPLAMIFVIFIIILGIGAAWTITANGAATGGPINDSFGNKPPENIINQDNRSAALAVAVMPIGLMAFIISICVVLVIVIAWLWKTGKDTKGKY